LSPLSVGGIAFTNSELLELRVIEVFQAGNHFDPSTDTIVGWSRGNDEEVRRRAADRSGAEPAAQVAIHCA
jgi:hypothetical protein